ncbi:MAG: saccharopine dehydrogenase NADP-binding domain-containing protein [Oscillospiraceae bacterium]|nr:saccharopine dehydrogenase NADP-binding domain-containing protein [Oscillospiraceae bacterium]
MKKILILGAGAQGSTVAQRLDEEPGVGEIICADYDQKAIDNLVKTLKKARGEKIDATKTEEIIKVARGADLIVNGLPVEFGRQVLDVALAVKAHYQDFAISMDLENFGGDAAGWADWTRYMYSEYGKKFAEIGKTALIGTGSAPGLICVVAKRAVRELSSCETIIMMVYEGGEAKRFLPFWWSPLVALWDMSDPGVAYIDGKIVETEPFGMPVRRRFPEMGGKEITLVEHHHEEPVIMGINADIHFKGAKNIYFKYGGSGLNFARPLYRAGLLSDQPVEIDGQMVVPFDVILHHLPPAPKFHQEIKEILDEGLVADEGCFVVECYGEINGKKVLVEAHISAPGIQESFNRAGLTAEMYLTGQSGFIFTKMFVEDKFDQAGLISTDMLNGEQVDYYLTCAEKFDLNLSLEIKDTQ